MYDIKKKEGLYMTKSKRRKQPCHSFSKVLGLLWYQKGARS
uniref:Uncharacterized protein n=1 Tax=Brassica oleracea TaxID=3712 RepID=A0A3P6F420_BRAOL|nr:unnamed protein product [Brassica oleracea]